MTDSEKNTEKETQNTDHTTSSANQPNQTEEKQADHGQTEPSTENTVPTGEAAATKKELSEHTEDQQVKGEEKQETKEENNAIEDSHSAEAESSVSENDEDEDEDELYGIPMKAYDEMNLDALGEELERLLHNHKVKEIRQHVREIKIEFDTKFGKERDLKKEAFLADGGNIIDFSYSTPAEQKFNKLYFEYKEKRDKYYKNVRKNLQDNLERRLAIIEELKAITGVGTDMNANFKAFKKLQERWRKAGPVPRADYKDTWNTYHYHVERFYDFLHLDREFREMDYKHNLEQKLKMIARAEELAEDNDINRAFRELQNLHRMWKEEVGPVAQEYREDVWEKFSAATKRIHENRKVYFAERDKQREENLKNKQEIIGAIEGLEKEEIKSHRQAQNKIKKFKDLRDKFFKAGKVPRKNNQETWNAFKAASHQFNHKKNEFYKARKQQQKENLSKKLELIKVAEEHKDSDDFKTVTPLMKKIQSDWKKIGHVKRSKSDKIWARFQAACNHYFDRLHARQDDREKAALEVYTKKVAFLDEFKALSLSGSRDEDLPKIKAKIEEWNNLGRVPRNKKGIERDFSKVLDSHLKQLDMGRKEVEMLKYENHLQALEEADNEEKIRKEASFLRKKIKQTTEEIRQLETNLEFFDNADKNNPLMKDVFKNIEQHKQQLKIWEAKLEKLRNL